MVTVMQEYSDWRSAAAYDYINKLDAGAVADVVEIRMTWAPGV